jgi:hypothetical protein
VFLVCAGTLLCVFLISHHAPLSPRTRTPTRPTSSLERRYRKKRFKALKSFAKSRAAEPSAVLCDEPTRTLYVIGLGNPDETVCAHVEQLLSQYEGFCGRLYLYAHKSYAMTQFQTAEQAARARTGLLGYTSQVLRKAMLVLEFTREPLRVDPVSDVVVPGLYLLEDFISVDYERELLDSVNALPWTT